jgi:transcriptional regulator with XRE-family HTH domain
MYDMENFAKRIQTLRKGKGLSQEELAGRLNVSSQAVSKWETGQSYPDITTIPTVAAVLDVSVDELFGRNPAEESYAFPKTYGGLPLVHSYRNAACYSDKTVSSADSSAVTFADGSTAELSSRLARNKGKGEIRFLQSGDIPEAGAGDKTANYEFPYADSLDLEVVSGQCEAVSSDDGMVRVDISGAGWFVRHHRVSQINGTLAIRFDGGFRDYPASDKNRIRIALPCKTGRNARLTLNAAGGINVPLEFESGEITINGSGCIHTGRVADCRSAINGSGVIHFDCAETASLCINGSGSIDAGEIEELNVEINGSGAVELKGVFSLRGQVNGSGDIEIGEIRGGDVSFQVNGSGDLHIGKGDCGLFDVKLAGSGDIGAEGVTAQRANIVIENNGDVTLGRVLEESSEQIKRNGTVKILNRGRG